MKKIILLAVLGLSLQLASAQINDHALGLRFGYGGGISYQHKFSKTTRGEFNGQFLLGSSYSTLRLTGIYQWFFDMDRGFGFYAGPGVSTGSVSIGDNYNGKGDNGFFVSVGGQVGIEYTFEDLPLQISIDVLPMFSVVNNYDDIYLDPALGIRYVF